MRIAMQLGGVEFNGNGFIVSAVHSSQDVERTVEAFDDAIGLLKDEGAF